MARRGHERGVLRGERREEKEREKALGGREAGGGRAGEFYRSAFLRGCGGASQVPWQERTK